jgi:hypothetical protein
MSFIPIAQSAKNILFNMSYWKGWPTKDGSRRSLAKAIAAAIQRASLTLARMAKGEVESSFFTPSSATPVSAPSSQKPVRFESLIKGWAAERRPVEKTVYEWTRVMRQLEKFLGHDDARRVTGENFVAWKGAMVEEGLRPKTIQDAKLAPMRAVFEWGFKNKLISANPAEGVSLEVKSKQGENNLACVRVFRCSAFIKCSSSYRRV